MLYIAFDQASNTTGYSIYKNKELLEYGKFSKVGENEFHKFSLQVEEIIGIIERTKNDYPKEKVKVIFEDIQMQQNVTTFKTLARLQGALGTAVLTKYPEIETTFVVASSWKSFCKVKGRNRAQQKKSAQEIVEGLFGVKATQDEADALLIGYHASHKEINWS